MRRVSVLTIGIILSILGFIVLIPNANASGPEAYEEMYWAFGGCLTCLTGTVIIIIALLRPNKEIDLHSNETENTTSIPPPVLSNDDA